METKHDRLGFTLFHATVVRRNHFRWVEPVEIFQRYLRSSGGQIVICLMANEFSPMFYRGLSKSLETPRIFVQAAAGNERSRMGERRHGVGTRQSDMCQSHHVSLFCWSIRLAARVPCSVCLFGLARTHSKLRT